MVSLGHAGSRLGIVNRLESDAQILEETHLAEEGEGHPYNSRP